MDAPDVIDLAEAAADEDAGGKARGLARLLAAGLPVPDGFVITGAAFVRVIEGAGLAVASPRDRPALEAVGDTLAAWARAALEAPLPAALEAEVERRARALGGALAVRSSMAIEDRADRAGAGLGRSELGVAPADVWRAIREVWAAALTPLVVAYARGDARPPAVIVQRQAPGTRVVIYTRPPGRPAADELWLDDGSGALRAPRGGAPSGWARAVDVALAAERAIDARAGADVELVLAAPARAAEVADDDDARVALVQARPIVHPPAVRRMPPPAMLLAGLRARPLAWRRDATHNPDPLSPAQAGLCAQIEAAGVAPFHLAVVAGHLYSAPREPAPPPPPPPVAVTDFEARFAALAARVDAALAAPAPAADLRAALARYLEAYRILAGELSPLVAAARRALLERLLALGLSPADAASRAAALAPARPSSVAASLGRAARGELDRAALDRELADVALAWDVAAPTFGEQPALVDAALARARARPAPPPLPAAPAELAAEVALARAAADAAERDDALFSRAQAQIRRALLAVADAHGLTREDIFWLPLDELLDHDHAHAALEPDRARARAAAARAAAARAAAWDMPLSLDDRPPAAVDRWQGAGVGGRVAGPAHKVAHLADATRAPRGAIVVTAAVTPALAIVLDGAAAIACEHGSILDHGAAMARELGIPCVVGCPGLTAAVADGDWLELDGEAGSLVRRP